MARKATTPAPKSDPTPATRDKPPATTPAPKVTREHITRVKRRGRE